MRDEEAELWYEPSVAVFLHEWYVDAGAAREALRARAGYLLPFRDHAYRGEAGTICALGLDPGDEDWGRIGRNGVQPTDDAAWRRLCERRRAHRRSSGGPVASDRTPTRNVPHGSTS